MAENTQNAPQNDAQNSSSQSQTPPVTEDNQHVEDMRLNTVANLKANQVLFMPQMEAIRKPENYVVRPEALGDSPDFVDCPWC
ncbi:uncharacterized protein PG998_012191 [Apiospora kogelbergensis]|uniref:Uncharacterized protein n=1 Tax=Apiospora kogelbergensis TaxID=1337665 RepID=A0AAW0QUD6_9PEZI